MCLEAHLGWGICEAAEVTSMTSHRPDSDHLRGYTFSAPILGGSVGKFR